MKKLALTLFAFGFLASFNLVCLGADNAAALPEQGADQGIVVSTVDINNASFEFGDNDELNISFDLYNEKGIQPGVKYAVELKPVGKQEAIDRKIYDDSLTIGENETIHKDITYVAPGYLLGEYEVWLVSRNEKGFYLGFNSLGAIIFNGTGEYIKVDSDSCAFSVSGDSKTQKITEAASLSADKGLTLNCSAINLFDSEAIVQPRVKTSAASEFGKTLKEQIGEKVTFKKGEKKTIQIAVPKENKAQGYEAVLSLMNENGDVVSNLVFARFTVSGPSATIFNAMADKNSYSKGDTANIALFWISRGSEKANITVSASLESKNSQCAKPFSKEIGIDQVGGKETINLPIINNCPYGKVVLTLKNDQKDILDEFSFYLQNPKNEPEAQAPAPAPSPDRKQPIKTSFLLYLLGGLILIAGIAIIIVKKVKSRSVTTLLILISSLLFIGSGLKTHGATQVCSSDMVVCQISDIWRNGNMNQHNNFCKGEYVIFDLWMGVADYNNWYYDSSTKANIYTGSGVYPNYGPQFIDPDFPYDGGLAAVHRIGTTAGTYRAHFVGVHNYNYKFFPFGSKRFESNTPLDYSILNCIPGDCGTSHKKTLATEPTANFCYKDRSHSTVKETSTRWTWTCYGSDGGPNAYCYANKKPFNGQCGQANHGSYADWASADAAGLCWKKRPWRTRTPFTVAGVDGWAWICKGQAGGTSTPAWNASEWPTPSACYATKTNNHTGTITATSASVVSNDKSCSEGGTCPTITWTTAFVSAGDAKVEVSPDPGGVNPFSTGIINDSKVANFIRTGTTYTFNLIEISTGSTLDSVDVRATCSCLHGPADELQCIQGDANCSIEQCGTTVSAPSSCFGDCDCGSEPAGYTPADCRAAGLDCPDADTEPCPDCASKNWKEVTP